ncbi:DUF4129 domain-containing protein [Stutzerimonas decontaminans]|uniref:DUF4129 domain-containing protein n=2 Tax=Stutzerimonas TaxID=2901164 RepID=A0ABX4VZ14_9GAMM|nr:membrane protein [Stutzerimonas decontaminans]AHY43964.1 membrane protein [Stutzerimonas decontaminans]MCQ4243734.1 DUF4129 domain-containing protein [Stutzerimonas decontaminans]PNF84576.1 DUF4129 domain-containing protein [Stutzerimonas decontaminans]
MQLSDACVSIRPRSPWEALDLGTLLARRHAKLLMASWAAITLPIFGLISLLLWQHPSAALLLFWWLKPLYERLPLHILSRALFGETPGFRESLKAFPGLLRSQWFASLTWRRLSTTRSFDLPVQQLEGLAGKARTQRLVTLSLRNGRAASWLTVVGVHLEGALWLGLLGALYFLLPAQLVQRWNWEDLLGLSGEWLWLEHLSNLLYVLVLIVWEPIYVACGFSLYLNRRTHLEAWDIELAFRRLRQRLLGALPMLLLACSLLLLPTQQLAWAAPAPQADETQPGPKSKRLLNQPMTSEAARERIDALLDQPPFQHRETVTRWRLGDGDNEEKQPGALARLIERLLQGGSFRGDLERLAQILEVLLWTALALLVALVLWRYREWLQTFGGRMRLPNRRRMEPPTQLFGLDVAPQSLPDDIAGEAERLWQQDPRAALALLYRGLLCHLLNDFQLPLKAAHTEGEVLRQVRDLQVEPLSRFAEQLTLHWQRQAYGHCTAEVQVRDALCADWRALFAVRTRP